MKKLLLIILIIFCSNCGPDCPPCPDESGNLGIPAEHWEILECAGFDEYVRDHVRCAYFIDDLKAEDGKPASGLACCDCNDIVINTKATTNIYECSTILHETYKLENNCVYDENEAIEKEKEFYNKLRLNSCYSL